MLQLFFGKLLLLTKRGSLKLHGCCIIKKVCLLVCLPIGLDMNQYENYGPVPFTWNLMFSKNIFIVFLRPSFQTLIISCFKVYKIIRLENESSKLENSQISKGVWGPLLSKVSGNMENRGHYFISNFFGGNYWKYA